MMLKKTIVRAFLLMCATLMLAIELPAMAQTAIIENGTAKATIYLDATAPASVKLAAADLQKYFKLISGVELPLVSNSSQLSGFVIYLGDTAFARRQGIKVEGLPSDGFRILSNKNWMIVAGKDYTGQPQVGFNNPYRLNESYNSSFGISAFGSAGTQFGVYYFLEHYCGVRWYMPGPLGTVLPKTSKIMVPLINLYKFPAFEHRYAYYCFMSRSDDDALWYRRAGFGDSAPIQISHSFGTFFLKYKDTHPEYFALIDGKRDFTDLSTSTGQGNLNLSNVGLIQQAIHDAIQYFDEHPEQKVFPLSPNDGMTRISEDPESQAQIDNSRGEAGKFSNYVWGFVNKVAKGVAKKYPNKLIGCLAYEGYSLPPSNIDHLNPNVAVVLTKFRASYPDAKIKKDTEDRITSWSKKASVIYAWEYNCNPLLNPAWKGYPMFFSKLLQDDLKFEKGKVKGEFIEAESWTPDQYWTAPDQIKINYPGLQHLLLYLNARLLWDPNLDVEKTLSEYYHLFYGPAEKPMRFFWELVESNWNKKSWNMDPLQVYDASTINKLLNYLKQAQKMSVPNTPYRQRVDLIYSEFSPAAETAARFRKLAKPHINIPSIAGPPNTDDKAPALKNGSTPVQLLDRNYNISSPATHLQLAWDVQNLYINMRCDEPNMAKLKTLATTRDSTEPPIWEDDAVELFLAPVPQSPADAPKTLHLIVTAAGILYDSKISAGDQREDREWNGNTKVTVTKEKNRWVACLAIPWTDLEIANPQDGLKLTANFYRSRYAGGQLEQSSWAPLKDSHYYSPEDFGLLTLAK